MKNIGSFFIELSVTFVVAVALSVLFGVVSLFVIGNIDGQLTTSNTQWVYSGCGAVMGIVLGYKVNTLVRTHVKDAQTKKKKK